MSELDIQNKYSQLSTIVQKNPLFDILKEAVSIEGIITDLQEIKTHEEKAHVIRIKHGLNIDIYRNSEIEHEIEKKHKELLKVLSGIKKLDPNENESAIEILKELLSISKILIYSIINNEDSIEDVLEDKSNAIQEKRSVILTAISLYNTLKNTKN